MSKTKYRCSNCDSIDKYDKFKRYNDERGFDNIIIKCDICEHEDILYEIQITVQPDGREIKGFVQDAIKYPYPPPEIIEF